MCQTNSYRMGSDMGQTTNLWEPEIIANGGSTFLEKTRQRSLRQFQLRAWRESRRDYFALPDDLREKIRADWRQWAGQKSATAYRHLVDCHSGAYSKRLRDIRDSEDRHAAMVIYGLSARVAPTLKVA